METKTFAWKVKSLDGEGVFSGLASTYGPPGDAIGDIVERGAFTKSIQDQGRGLPVLWQHRSDQPVGIGRLSDQPAGLVIEGQLVMEDPIARRAHAHMKAGSVKGLSIGYEPIKATPRANGGRTLQEIRLHEVSIVTMPMNARAEVSQVKALLPSLASLTVDDLEDEGLLSDLQSIERHVKRLLPAGVSADEQLVWLRGIDQILRRLVT